ncbi:MAG TPA: hypothetical protein VF192_04020 [Longimicrobiales bacterium]
MRWLTLALVAAGAAWALSGIIGWWTRRYGENTAASRVLHR